MGATDSIRRLEFGCSRRIQSVVMDCNPNLRIPGPLGVECGWDGARTIRTINGCFRFFKSKCRAPVSKANRSMASVTREIGNIRNVAKSEWIWNVGD